MTSRAGETVYLRREERRGHVTRRGRKRPDTGCSGCFGAGRCWVNVRVPPNRANMPPSFPLGDVSSLVRDAGGLPHCFPFELKIVKQVPGGDRKTCKGRDRGGSGGARGSGARASRTRRAQKQVAGCISTPDKSVTDGSLFRRIATSVRPRRCGTPLRSRAPRHLSAK